MRYTSSARNSLRANTRLLLTSAMALLMTLVLPAPAAWSATQQASVEEIVVTARRREETLQEVPAALQVVTNMEMFTTGNDSMDKLRDVIPNFNFASDLAYRSRVAVRGIGSDRSGAQTNGVGFFIDGVYQSGTARFNAPFFDVERVEVLKGPQGARYGRNSFAGVVNVVTRKPSDEFHTSFQATTENQGGVEYAGLISGPIVEGKLFGKVSFAHNETDGDYKNALTGRYQAPLESEFYNARLIWQATERLEFDLSLSKDDNDGIAYAFSQTTDLNHPKENYLVRDDSSAGQDNEDVTLTAIWSGDNIEILNRISYRDSLTHLDVDADVTVYDAYFAVIRTKGEQWGEELRIQSAGDGPFHWMVGAEYIDGEYDALFDTYLLDSDQIALASWGCTECVIPQTFGFPAETFVDLFYPDISSNTIVGDSTNWSVFGEVSYLFFDRLEATFSIRYDDIDNSVFNFGAGLAGSGGAGLDFKDDAWQPLFSLRYSVDEDTSVYASAAKGIREGGFNSSALTKDYASFDTDEVWSYEVGLKKRFTESGAYLNVSAFYMDAKVLNQAAIIVTDAGSLANGAITMGGADSYGVELEFGMPIGAGIAWDMNLGLLDCTLKDVPDYADRSVDFQQVSPGVQDGNTCQDSSEWTFYTALDGRWALGGTSWHATAAVSLSAKGDTRMTSDAGTPGRTFPFLPSTPEEVAMRNIREDQSIRDPLYLVNASAGLQNDSWTIIAYVENLTNKRYAIDHFSHEGLCDSGICGMGAGNFITTLAPKIRYGLRLRYDL